MYSQKSLTMHGRLRAYDHALAFYRTAKNIRSAVPRGHANLVDQLARASSSVVLNLAEGAAAYHRPMKRRYFRIALASAGECVAALELLDIEAGIDPDLLRAARIQILTTTRITVGLVR